MIYFRKSSVGCFVLWETCILQCLNKMFCRCPIHLISAVISFRYLSIFGQDDLCLSCCFLLLWWNTMTKAEYKGEHLIGSLLQFQGLVRDHHGRECVGTQAGVVLEQQLRAYIWSTGWRQREQDWGWHRCLKLKTHPQWHTSSNKTPLIILPK